MGDSSAMSPADIMALSKDGMGDNSLIYMFFIFALLFGWGGNGFGGNGFQNAIGYENLATSNEIQRGFDNQNSMANEREILAAVNQTAANGIAAGTQNTQYMTGMLNDKYNELQRDVATLAVGQGQLLANQNECCAGISAGIAQNRYEAALNAGNIVQAIQADGNATRQMIQQDKIESLQQKVAALENGMQTAQLQSDIAAATANTIRWPNQWTYGAGMPPIWNTCGCGQYNM